jgi:hypothetical protein
MARVHGAHGALLDAQDRTGASMSSEITEELSIQTRDLIARFEERANSFVGRRDLEGLVAPVDRSSSVEFVRDFLGEGEHVATGIADLKFAAGITHCADFRKATVKV